MQVDMVYSESATKPNELGGQPMGKVAGRKEGTLWLGTQSWSHESWRGVFYSEAAEARAFIREYAEQFPVVEIDSTWYRIPTPYQIAHWHDQTPENFLFTAKVPRIITHEKVLSDCQGELTAFLRVMDGLGEKLGPLLFQFPYFNKNAFSSPNPFFDRLSGFLASLPEGYRFAVEIRNKNWLLPRLVAFCERMASPTASSTTSGCRVSSSSRRSWM